MAATENQNDQNLQLPETIEELQKEVHKLRATVIAQEKLANVGLLTLGILHEIKNPLNFVINFSKISLDLTEELNELIEKLKEKLQPDEQDELKDISDTLKENLSRISENGYRAMRIMTNMLAQSRDQNTVKFSETDVNQLVDEFTKLAYQGIRGQDKDFNLSIKTDYDASLLKVRVDAHDLSRAILNIVNNACYAVDEKKKKSGDSSYVPQISVATKKLQDAFIIRIKDNGMGIPASVVKQIFTPFFTTKPSGEGTGLGLSMSYDIITKIHKGTLEVNAAEGEYTEFVITIPISESN